MNEYILELNDIVKTFGSSVALNGMHFKLKPGEVHALMGENGAGKSTFIKVITGVFQPDSGEIIYNGKRIQPKNSIDSQNLGIAAIYQHATVFPDLSVTENIFMGKELQKDMYKGKVDPKLDIKYGNDEPTESRRQADAFIAENKVDMIVSPTTIGMFAAGEALKSSGSDIKLTGLGLPSEMKDYMPKKPTDNAFDYICPYMLLWNVKELGEITAVATLASAKGEYDGKIGSTFTYKGKEFKTITASDGGSCVIALDPYFFHKGNIADWVDVL